MPNSRHSAKKAVTNTVSRAAYAECRDFAESLALGKEVLCRVPLFAECPALGKELFAECPIFDTRQRILHSAKSLFPVVLGTSAARIFTYVQFSGTVIMIIKHQA